MPNDEKTEAEKNAPLTYAEIKRRLKTPIPTDLLSEKSTGGTKIKFVNVTDVKDLLDERVGNGYWEVPSSEIVCAGGILFMTLTLVITASDGVFCHVGHGNEALDLKSYGDPTSNAYAQALRRAAESHGLARELWRMEISAEQWELPATKVQIAILHDIVGKLGKTEAACALHYSEQRADLFGDLQIKEAARAISELERKIPNGAAAGVGGKKQ